MISGLFDAYNLGTAMLCLEVEEICGKITSRKIMLKSEEYE
jgi:hypothetical protein